MPQALISGKLKRTTSTPQILEPSVTLTSANNKNSINNHLTPKMTNGVISARTTPTPLRFATSPSQKGLMHRFLATRGRIFNKNSSPPADCLSPPLTPTIVLNPQSIRALSKSLEVRIESDDEPKKPQTRRGYVPVEEKIQKELNDMKERENELRLMRSRMLAKSQPNLIEIGNDNDSDIYDGSNSLRSGTSSNILNDDDSDRGENRGSKHKPNPRRRSTLIAQWENLIAANKESLENGNENENNV
ncbi:mitotic spindle positioning protein meduse isoform X2 [Cotesia typhae]